MRAIKILNLLTIILALFFFNGCTKTISEEQKAVEKQIMAFLTSLDEAASQQDWTEIYRIVNDYFAEDILIRVEDPNRKEQQIQMINLQQYRFMLQQAPQVILDYQHQHKHRKIEVAPDSKSARVTSRHLETTTMRKEVAVMFAAYLFKDKDMATIDPQVTIKNEEQITMKFEYREDGLFVTEIDSKITKMELL